MNEAKRRQGGLNEADRLKTVGIEAKKASVTRAPLGQLVLLREGPTAHPRADLPPDEALVQHIMQHGMIALDGTPWTFLAREIGVDPATQVMRLEIGNGSRRENAGLEAERRLRETAPRTAPLTWEKDDPSDLGRLYVNIKLVNLDDAAFLKARLAANSEPGKLPDSTQVLAITVAQITAAKVAAGDDVDLAEIVAVMPSGVGRKEVDALARWELLTREAKAYVVEHDLPPGLLSAILEAPRTEQLAVAKTLHEAGVRTTGGATRMLNRQRAASSGEATTTTKGKRWAPKKLLICAKAIVLPAPPVDLDDIADGVVTRMKTEELRALVERAEANGFAKALNFAGGGKTGKLPALVREAIKATNGASKKAAAS